MSNRAVPPEQGRGQRGPSCRPGRPGATGPWMGGRQGTESVTFTNGPQLRAGQRPAAEGPLPPGLPGPSQAPSSSGRAGPPARVRITLPPAAPTEGCCPNVPPSSRLRSPHGHCPHGQMPSGCLLHEQPPTFPGDPSAACTRQARRTLHRLWDVGELVREGPGGVQPGEEHQRPGCSLADPRGWGAGVTGCGRFPSQSCLARSVSQWSVPPVHGAGGAWERQGRGAGEGPGREWGLRAEPRGAPELPAEDGAQAGLTEGPGPRGGRAAVASAG